MSFTLDQIIQQGGPVGFALLFAWLWLNQKKETAEARLEAAEARNELKQKLIDDLEMYRRIADGGVANA